MSQLLSDEERQRLPMPSLGFLSVILFLFLFHSTVLSFLQPQSAPLKRQFKDHLSMSEKGVDFNLAYRAAGRFLRQESVYRPATGPDFGYPPQSLTLLAPFAFLARSQAYTSMIVTGFLLFIFLFLGVSHRFNQAGMAFYTLFIPVVLLLGQPSLYVLERGNFDLMGATLVAAGLFFFCCSRNIAAAMFLALASSLKPQYFPYIFLILAFRKKGSAALAYLGVHAILLFSGVLVTGSFGVLSEFLPALSAYVARASTSYGATNIGILSVASVFFELIGLGTVPALLMTTTASVLCLFLLLGIAFYPLMSKFTNKELLSREDSLLLFASLCYTSVLWQSYSPAYAMLPLLLLVPLCDYFYLRASRRGKQILTVHAILLGFAFAPNEFWNPFFKSFKAPYLFGAFAFFLCFYYQQLAVPSGRQR